MNRLLAIVSLGLALAGSVGSSSAESTASSSPPVGLLVMAHGGTPEWNQAVEEAVAPLRGSRPVEIAFGMADRASLQQAVSRLEEQGADRIAVVRLFISGHSFKHQTEYFLGLRTDPPAQFIEHPGHGQAAPSDAHAGHGHGDHGHSHGATAAPASTDASARKPVDRRAEITLSAAGLDEDTAMLAQILGERAAAQSSKPSKEAVLLLGHGVEDDKENALLRDRLDAVAGRIRKQHKFAAVGVETLREDWREKRAEAEKRIHDHLVAQQMKGRQVIVVPARVYGFGPYREVLGENAYFADEKGLLPHPAMTQWIARQYEQVCATQGWQTSGFGDLEAAPQGGSQ